jgi:hypothetical protein
MTFTGIAMSLKHRFFSWKEHAAPTDLKKIELYKKVNP